jgi:hypothetical protein
MKIVISVASLCVIFFGIFVLEPKAFTKEEKSLKPLKLMSDKDMMEAAIEDVAWIAGHWGGEMFDGVAEEIWSPPSGNSMMGMYKLMKEGEVVFYEFLVIVMENNDPVLRLKHFDGDFKGWEEKDKYIEFPFIKCSENEIEFEGLTFRKINSNRMDILLRLKSNNGQTRTEHFKLSRK